MGLSATAMAGLAHMGGALARYFTHGTGKVALKLKVDPTKRQIAVGTVHTGFKLPKGAVVTRAFYNVRTAFTSANSTATIAVQLKAANDVLQAVAINNVSNPFTTLNTPKTCKQDNAIANFLVQDQAQDQEFVFVVGTEPLTAGELDLYVEYVYP